MRNVGIKRVITRGVSLFLAATAGLATLAAVGCSALGVFGGERGRMVVVLHPGYATTDWLLEEITPILTEAAREGAALEAWILPGGSAAGMTKVRFSADAGEGDFFPDSKNQSGWDAEAEKYAAGAVDDIEAVLATLDPEADRTGADIIGALRTALQRVDAVVGKGDQSVVLVTGGGVVRVSDRLDLVEEGVTPASAPGLARRVGEIDPAGVAVSLIGVGRFENVEPPVDPVFANGVIRFYESLCPACTLS